MKWDALVYHLQNEADSYSRLARTVESILPGKLHRITFRYWRSPSDMVVIGKVEAYNKRSLRIGVWASSFDPMVDEKTQRAWYSIDLGQIIKVSEVKDVSELVIDTGLGFKGQKFDRALKTGSLKARGV